MVKKVLEHSDGNCTYCDTNGVQLMTNTSTGKFMCRSCADAVHTMFVRVDELEVMADKFSAEMAEENDGYRDDDGECHCPACTFNSLLRMDPVLKGLFNQSGAVAENIDIGTDKRVVH